MCRIFTVENEKLNRAHSKNSYQNGGNSRSKRETGEMKPTVNVNTENVEKAKRVESIVDKLYEDIVEDGAPVTYRHRNLETLTTKSYIQEEKNKTMRRFNFAPAELLGPLPTGEPFEPSNPEDVGTGIDWPKRWKHGIVPYFIDSKTYDAHLAEVIMQAFEYFEKATCIRLQRLKDRPTDKDSLQNVEWLYITNPAGVRQCVHSNERKTNKGVQMVVFGYDCLSLGEIVHEVMHILGFSHEHTRPDRDQHITILWNNIKSGYKKYFETREKDVLQNIPYDFASVLHYPPRAFSKNGQVTIMAQPGVKLGQRQGLSEGDVEKVAVIYGHECVDRNRQYLLKTCPSVVRADTEPKNITQEEIEEYFVDRLWRYGVVNYKLRDQMEFSAEEKENIRAVIRHIEKETCIKFRDITPEEDDDTDDEAPSVNEDENSETEQTHPLKKPVDGAPAETAGEAKIEGKDAKGISDNEVKHGDVEVSTVDARNEHDDINILRSGTAIPQIAKANKRSRVEQQKSQRRHAADILVFARGVEPGCECPTPGKPNGNKVLKINADCFNSVNDLLHLFMHILGFDHQHNMHDRDSYLHILWDNLTPEIRKEMSKKLPPAASLGLNYDYQSVMHYPWLQIKDGVTNIMYPIWNDGWAMGHWQGLSSTDVMKINLLYFKQCLSKKSLRKK
ncbi:uncharacterized protein LOC114359000 [Ostrinia furnacalis]|uniref:uncharacterized protein LOC114359000 n=1 Tax=Ostrinia furnacalis TaxID=93504 RepID=UPI00103BB39B|nr:uncharacterized protein LOC114359000 [Ostrinia furnacalis]